MDGVSSRPFGPLPIPTTSVYLLDDLALAVRRAVGSRYFVPCEEMHTQMPPGRPWTTTTTLH